MANKRLLKEDDELVLGDVIMLRNRFDKNKYALFKVSEIDRNKEGKIVYFYVDCFKTSNSYRLGSSVGCDFRAHTTHNSKSVELTYIIPAGRILYGKT